MQDYEYISEILEMKVIKIQEDPTMELTEISVSLDLWEYLFDSGKGELTDDALFVFGKRAKVSANFHTGREQSALPYDIDCRKDDRPDLCNDCHSYLFLNETTQEKYCPKCSYSGGRRLK